jgi:hypothetical protein
LHRVSPEIEADVGANISDENYSRDVKGLRAIRGVIDLEREDLAGRILVGRHFTREWAVRDFVFVLHMAWIQQVDSCVDPLLRHWRGKR